MLSRYLLATVAATALLIGQARADSTVAAMTAAGALAGPELFYCVQTAADHNCTATQLKTFVTSSGVVTSVGFSVPATSIFTATGSPVTGAGTLGFTTAGTSGGIPYFSSAAALSSSAVLTANLPVIGGGAGVAPTVGSVSGTTTKFATVNTTTFATGQCVQVDASLNLTTTGSACGAGGGGTTIGTTTITGGTSGNFLYNNAGVYGERTPTQATAVLIPFSTTTTAQGVVPGSNGAAATSFLNATGAWSVPAGGGGAPGGSTTQVQYNNAGAFGGANVYVESANVLAQRNATTAQAYYVYNTFTDASNYERGVMDWTTTANVLTIGAQVAGTGQNRPVLFSAGSRFDFFSNIATVNVFSIFNANQPTVQVSNGWSFAWSSTGSPNGSADVGINRVAPKVVSFTDSSNSIPIGWHQWAGEARATANTSIISSTTLVPVTGLTTNVQAGRTYGFQAELSGTWAAAGGVRAAIAGTATATNIVYDGWIVDSAANGIKGNAQSAALAGVVANAATTGTAGHVTISGAITVNAAGTLLVQAAQSVSNAGATAILQGSTFFVWDMP